MGNSQEVGAALTRLGKEIGIIFSISILTISSILVISFIISQPFAPKRQILIIFSIILLSNFLTYIISTSIAFPSPYKAEVIEFSEKDIQNINNNRLSFTSFSKSQISKKLYGELFKIGTDSIRNWYSNDLKYYYFQKSDLNNIFFDNLMLVNKDSSSCLLLYYKMCPKDTSCKSNYLCPVYGNKINNKWYFVQDWYPIQIFQGSYSSNYQEKISLDKMKLIAFEEFYQYYFSKKKLNGNFVKGFTNDQNNLQWKNRKGWGNGICDSCKTYDEYFLFLSKRKWFEKFEPIDKDKVAINYNKNKSQIEIKFHVKQFDKFIDEIAVSVNLSENDGLADCQLDYSKYEKNKGEYTIIKNNILPNNAYKIRIAVRYLNMGNCDGATHHVVIDYLTGIPNFPLKSYL